MKENFRNTIGMFDLLKGVFVLWMFFIHSTFSVFQLWDTSIERSWIEIVMIFLYKVSFGFIPALFLICGYEFRKKSMRKAISTQIKFVWKPYLRVAVFTIALTSVIIVCLGESVFPVLKKLVLSFMLCICPNGTYFNISMYSIGPVWCVVTYVFAGIFLNAVLQEEQTWVQVFLVFVLAAVGVALGDHGIPFCIKQSLICTFYMYIGWAMKKYRFFEKKIPPYVFAAAALLMAYTAYKGPFDASGNYWPNGLTDVLSGLFGGVLLMIVSTRLNDCDFSLFNGIRWLGRHVMQICCIHTVFFDTLPIVFERLPISRGNCSVLLFSIYFITAVVGCLVIEKRKRRITA